MIFRETFCDYWTRQTKTCFRNKGQCSKCIENEICKQYGSDNIYGMRNVKYAMIKTFEKLGKPKRNV